MQMEKKQILKEDGRYLVYYHFPESASPEEMKTFAAIEAADVATKPQPTATVETTAEEQAHV